MEPVSTLGLCVIPIPDSDSPPLWYSGPLCDIATLVLAPCEWLVALRSCTRLVFDDVALADTAATEAVP